MSSKITAMRAEALEAGSRIAEQLSSNKPLIQDISTQIARKAPSFVVMVGRGSSDHAALFAKYLIEIETGLPVVSAAPSVATTYKVPIRLSQAVVIIISQSGRSPDLVEYAEMANNQGAYTIALVNDSDSPLAGVVNAIVPLAVGAETAVAATKSYLGSLSALLQLVSELANSDGLRNAVDHIPQALESGVNSDSQLRLEHVSGINHCVVTGRGFGFAIGMEIALKLKEVCAIQAECFSGAEFLHGPVRIVSDNFHVLDILIRDETYESHSKQAEELVRRGAIVTRQECQNSAIHPRIAPLVIMQRFYLDLELIGRQMGFNPDKPEGLSKVTETR